MIPMPQNLIDFEPLKIRWKIGDPKTMEEMQTAPALEPFAPQVLEFLGAVSRQLMTNRAAKAFPDVVTLGFWLRKSSLEQLRSRFVKGDLTGVALGRGICFHIAPSNVPVNYAYSLFTGLLCGNKNVVRIPSKDFEQVELINGAIRAALARLPQLKPYLCLVQYGHDLEVNRAFSALADVRVIWGGDNTIAEIRKAPLKPRATEVTFADRYSLAVLDAQTYLSSDQPEQIAQDFYNDTYLTDQNACTSPRIVAWVGENRKEAKARFWDQLYRLVREKYPLSGVQAVNKLTSGYLLAAVSQEGEVTRATCGDNLVVRMQVTRPTAALMDLKDNSGYFFEYDCRDIMELRDLCDDIRCQTISYLGDREMFRPLLASGIQGVDRIVPVGKTMDFDWIWDGYNLYERLTRAIAIE